MSLLIILLEGKITVDQRYYNRCIKYKLAEPCLKWLTTKCDCLDVTKSPHPGLKMNHAGVENTNKFENHVCKTQ